jgi:type III pantothenate kinase
LLDRRSGFSYIPGMLLAIDIGNTNTAVGVFDEEALLAHFRVTSQTQMTVDEAGLFVSSLFNHHIEADAGRVADVAVCSVVPTLTGVYEEMARKYFKVEPIIINARAKLPIAIDYPEPSEIGADRLANAAAGYHRVKKSLIVVDLGTAINFDVVSEKGAYIGGVIAPGTQAAGANLAKKAARLFEVRSEKPHRVIGKSTAEALKSGLFYGTIGVIDHILERIFDELGGQTFVIGTGGEAEIFCRESKYVGEIVPTLTLEGIRLIADLNRKKT